MPTSQRARSLLTFSLSSTFFEAEPSLEKAAPAVRPTALSFSATPAAIVRSLRVGGCTRAGSAGSSGGTPGMPRPSGVPVVHRPFLGPPDAQLGIDLVHLVFGPGGGGGHRAHRGGPHLLGARHHLRATWRQGRDFAGRSLPPPQQQQQWPAQPVSRQAIGAQHARVRHHRAAPHLLGGARARHLCQADGKLLLHVKHLVPDVHVDGLPAAAGAAAAAGTPVRSSARLARVGGEAAAGANQHRALSAPSCMHPALRQRRWLPTACQHPRTSSSHCCSASLSATSHRLVETAPLEGTSWRHLRSCGTFLLEMWSAGGWQRGASTHVIPEPASTRGIASTRITRSVPPARNGCKQRCIPQQQASGTCAGTTTAAPCSRMTANGTVAEGADWMVCVASTSMVAQTLLHRGRRLRGGEQAGRRRGRRQRQTRSPSTGVCPLGIGWRQVTSRGPDRGLVASGSFNSLEARGGRTPKPLRTWGSLQSRDGWAAVWGCVCATAGGRQARAVVPGCRNWRV